MSGQFSIRYLGERLAKYINTVLDTGMSDDEINSLIIYQDTDSCVSDTVISVNNSNVTIGDFFDSVQTVSEYTPSGAEVRQTPNCHTNSIDDNGELVQKSIRYVMRHKTTKQMYRVTVAGRSVEVTEDHSLIVRRNGKIVSATVKELQSGDEFIYVST